MIYSNIADKIVDVTYSSLTDIISGGDLIPGQYYRITDFATTRKIAGTLESFTETVEPLIVMSLTSSKLHSEAFSESFPKDVIRYTPYQPVEIESDGLSFNHTGHIYFRLDTLSGNEAWYDWRGVKNRRWMNFTTSNFTGITSIVKNLTPSSWDPGVTVSILKSDVTVFPNPPFVITVTGTGAGTYTIESVSSDLNNWILTTTWTPSSEDINLGVILDKYTFNNTRIPVSSSTYFNKIDLRTPPGTYIDLEGNQLYASDLNNIIIENGGFNTFGGDCINITLGPNSFYNIFYPNCYNIILGEGGYKNTFLSGSTGSVFGTGNDFNTVGPGANVILGNNSMYNTILANSYGNIIGNECYYNIIGGVATYLENNCTHITTDIGVDNITVLTGSSRMNIKKSPVDGSYWSIVLDQTGTLVSTVVNERL